MRLGIEDPGVNFQLRSCGFLLTAIVAQSMERKWRYVFFHLGGSECHIRALASGQDHPMVATVDSAYIQGKIPRKSLV
jgi:hypothetical protein